MNYQQRKQGLLDAFKKHEQMHLLLSCLPRSPDVFADDSPVDDEEEDLRDALEEQGLLEDSHEGWSQTTEAGREALIAYINGE